MNWALYLFSYTCLIDWIKFELNWIVWLVCGSHDIVLDFSVFNFFHAKLNCTKCFSLVEVGVGDCSCTEIKCTALQVSVLNLSALQLARFIKVSEVLTWKTFENDIMRNFWFFLGWSYKIVVAFVAIYSSWQPLFIFL